MKVDAKILDTHYDFGLKGTTITFITYGNITPSVEEFLNKEVSLEIKKNNIRSHNANAYLWTLLGELQAKTRVPKEEIYREYIKTCGSYTVYCMKTEAVDQFKKIWSSQGLGWVCEETESKIKDCTNVLAYKGTSMCTREEMAVILDQVVQDCIALQIPTKPKEEIDTLLNKM